MLTRKKKVDFERISFVVAMVLMGFSMIYFAAHKWILAVINKWAQI